MSTDGELYKNQTGSGIIECGIENHSKEELFIADQTADWKIVMEGKCRLISDYRLVITRLFPDIKDLTINKYVELKSGNCICAEQLLLLNTMNELGLEVSIYYLTTRQYIQPPVVANATVYFPFDNCQRKDVAQWQLYQYYRLIQSIDAINQLRARYGLLKWLLEPKQELDLSIFKKIFWNIKKSAHKNGVHQRRCTNMPFCIIE